MSQVAPSTLRDIQASSFIGFTMALLMYGISLCQYYYYFSEYPKDGIFQRCLILLLWTGNTVQIYCVIYLQWSYLVSARHSIYPTSPAFSWQSNAYIVAMFAIPFVVQCFYGGRLWIISNKNVMLVACVILLSSTQFVSGVAFQFGVQLPLEVLRALFSLTGVIGDILITASVYYYLRPSRFIVGGRRQSAIHRIVMVTVNMGALTSIIALLVWVMWVTQGPVPRIMTPLLMMSQSYVNSILAVLNARGPPMEKSQNPDRSLTSIRLPTLSMPEYSHHGQTIRER